MNRRDLLKFAALAGVAGALPAIPGKARAQQVAASGDVEIMTVSDGSLRLPPSFALPDMPKKELEAVLGNLPASDELVERPLNLTLLKKGEQVVLFDVGSGHNFMPSAGKLADSMDALGVSADEVTDIVFTHGHPDHLWGLLDDFDEIAFPEATAHFPREEFDFWMSDNAIDQMPDDRKVFAVGAKSRLEAIADQVQLFDAGAEVVAGVEAMATRGHTPGHTSFVIHGPGDPVMVIGDALTHEILSFVKPEWPAGGDQDKDLAAATRKLLLDRLASEKMLIIGYHLPDGGDGYVERNDAAFRFTPA